MKIIQKLRRELLKPLSKLGFNSATVNYFGLNLKVPLINGVGTGYLVPGDKWMSTCLSVFLDQKDGAVIDIGANIGLYMVVLKSLNKNRDYYGFEPNPMCNYYTQELVSSNNFKNVRMFPFALPNNKELRTLYAARKAAKTGSLLEHAQSGKTKSSSFDLFTFPGEEFFELLNIEHICAMKVDVEGLELEVLTGLKNTLATYKPFIFCEIWHLPEISDPTYDEKYRRADAICKLLDEFDYTILGVTKNTNNLIDIKTVNDFNDDQKTDYILTHKSEHDTIFNALDGK